MDMSSNPNPVVKIRDLKPGMNGVNVVVRVLETHGVRSIRTRSGDRTIGEYVVGDETGRVKLIAWGSKAASLAANDVVEIRGAWVSVYRGEVQLNIGRSSNIERLEDEAVAPEEEIPDEHPSPPPEASTYTGFRSFSRARTFRSGRSRGGRRGRR